jgi:glutamyl/glutaminyl-tRNA synthetase
LRPLVKQALQEASLWKDEFEEGRLAWFLKLIDLLKERSRTIQAFPKAARPFIAEEIPYDSEGIQKHLMHVELNDLWPRLTKDFIELDEFSEPKIEGVLRERAEIEGVKAALLIHALRMVVTGEPVSPGIFAVLELVGKEKTIKRMKALSNIKDSVDKREGKNG